MKNYCDPTLAKLLNFHRLDNFEALWNLQAESVEDPNNRRGGWSGVCRLPLVDGEGTTHSYFLKRQQNHLTRCGILGFKKPTFYREYRSILLCQERNLPCLDVAYYAERKHPATANGKNGLDYQAILITPALENYTPFSEIVFGWRNLDEATRFRYLQEIARLAADLHKNRLSHNGLYPQHLFLNLDAIPPVKMIDMERMCFQFRKAKKSVAELETFLRRAGVFSEEEMEFFLGQYCRYHPSGLSLEVLKKAISVRLKAKTAQKKAAA